MSISISPETKLETPRGMMRLPSRDDFPAIMSASRVPGFNDGMTWDPPSSQAQLESSLASTMIDWESGVGFAWTLEARNDKAIIGRFGIRVEDRDAHVWSIGFWIHPTFQSQGYATEGATELVKFGFQSLGAQKIEAAHAKWNLSSGRVLQKIGMKRVGETHEGFLKNGEWVAEDVYEISR